jgi:3-oxosteroid 1-dehydrogenase
VTEWDESYDVVIVGSGGGALVAAIAAAHAGLTPVVLEKESLVGGSTALSGGVIWIPNNPLMRAEGVPDSHSDALAYFEAVVGDAGPASSPERREKFLTAGSEMIMFLQQQGLAFLRCPGYSDYYDTCKGGNAQGRSLEPAPFDAKQLGEWHGRIRAGQARAIGLAVKTNEIRRLIHYNRSPESFAVAGQIWARTQLARLRGQDLVVSGEALMSRLVRIAVDRGIPIRTDVPTQDLVVEDGGVAGVRILQDGAPVRIEARRATLLAAGGFGHNAEMRRKYSGDQPNDARWSKANPGDTGEVLAAAMALGAKTDLLDEAWWLPSTVPELGHSTLSMARQRPGAIFVDRTGERFCNESNSYVEVGKAMYARHAVPCWLVFDDGYRRRYAAMKSLPGKLPREWVDRGWIKKADTLAGLAQIIDVEPSRLERTVERFNANAARGVDPDFGRGDSAYNRNQGDPGYKPNHALGPLDRAPYYAAEIYPGDVGTCGGLLTNEHAQVLGSDGAPIPRLYATGNITATVMGRTYPGAGASIANSMVFGFVAARHAARNGG